MTLLERPKNWRDLAAGFVLNNLSDEEMMLWKVLCAKDPELEQEAGQMQQTFNQFADVIPLHVPPQHLPQQLIDDIKGAATVGLHQYPLGRISDINSSSSNIQGRPMGGRSSKRSTNHVSHWLALGAMMSVGVIGWLSGHVHGLQQQVQQVNEQLILQQQLLQTTNDQMADIHQQLEETTNQLMTVEDDLAQLKEQAKVQEQERKEAMQQYLQPVTPDL